MPIFRRADVMNQKSAEGSVFCRLLEEIQFDDLCLFGVNQVVGLVTRSNGQGLGRHMSLFSEN